MAGRLLFCLLIALPAPFRRRYVTELLDAFDDCGGSPLAPSARVADEPLAWPLPGGAWEPENPDGRFRGVIDVRTALADSLNVPFVRLARHCGLNEVAATLRRAGLTLPDDPPPVSPFSQRSAPMW